MGDYVSFWGERGIEPITLTFHQGLPGECVNHYTSCSPVNDSLSHRVYAEVVRGGWWRTDAEIYMQFASLTVYDLLGMNYVIRVLWQPLRPPM